MQRRSLPVHFRLRRGRGHGKCWNHSQQNRYNLFSSYSPLSVTFRAGERPGPRGARRPGFSVSRCRSISGHRSDRKKITIRRSLSQSPDLRCFPSAAGHGQVNPHTPPASWTGRLIRSVMIGLRRRKNQNSGESPAHLSPDRFAGIRAYSRPFTDGGPYSAPAVSYKTAFHTAVPARV